MVRPQVILHGEMRNAPPGAVILQKLPFRTFAVHLDKICRAAHPIQGRSQADAFETAVCIMSRSGKDRPLGTRLKCHRATVPTDGHWEVLAARFTRMPGEKRCDHGIWLIAMNPRVREARPSCYAKQADVRADINNSVDGGPPGKRPESIAVIQQQLHECHALGVFVRNI